MIQSEIVNEFGSEFSQIDFPNINTVRENKSRVLLSIEEAPFPD